MHTVAHFKKVNHCFTPGDWFTNVLFMHIVAHFKKVNHCFRYFLTFNHAYSQTTNSSI